MYPLPTDRELERFYNSYWEDRTDGRRLDKLVERANARARFLAPYLADRETLRVVDVGAGFGHIYTSLAAALPGRDIEYDAVEVDPDAVRYLVDVLRARAVHDRIERFPGPYDLMVMSHFLEHLQDPVGYLAAQRRRIATGGLLFVEVPNADYRFKDHDQPHLSFFEVETLTRVVESAGFEVVRIDTCGAPASEIRRARSGKSKKPGHQHTPWRRLRRWAREKVAALHAEKSRAKRDPHLETYGGDRRWIRAIVANAER
jgi:2-polyprenyl-3-methyl-5-hydroxy-6-metoxy-1,4-benzoquinol methylase